VSVLCHTAFNISLNYYLNLAFVADEPKSPTCSRRCICQSSASLPAGNCWIRSDVTISLCDLSRRVATDVTWHGQPFPVSLTRRLAVTWSVRRSVDEGQRLTFWRQQRTRWRDVICDVRRDVICDVNMYDVVTRHPLTPHSPPLYWLGPRIGHLQPTPRPDVSSALC